MAWLLQQDEELQGILSDALMRSEQHRENYLRYILQLDPRTSSLYSFTIIIISTAPPPALNRELWGTNLRKHIKSPLW